jgi:hypothetical protein
MALLRRRRLNVVLVFVAGFLRARPSLNAARTAVEAGVAVVVVHDHRAIHIHVAVEAAADVQHGAVIREVPAIPASAHEAHSAKPEAVVDSAIEADVRAPVACVESIHSTRKAPIGRGPQDAYHRRLHPHAGNPVVAAFPIGPVAGVPEIPIARNHRLHIHRQRRRSKPHADPNDDTTGCVRG